MKQIQVNLKYTFGDGVLGKKLEQGNIVILDYIVSNKSLSNGAKTFTLSGSIGGFSNIQVTTKSVSQGGSEAETKESIRYNAHVTIYSARQSSYNF